MQAAVAVADHVQLAENSHVMNPPYNTLYGWNPYFEMYANVDLSGYDEVLFWRQYAKTGSFSIMHGTPAWIASGSNHGLLKSYTAGILFCAPTILSHISSAVGHSSIIFPLSNSMPPK